MKSPFKSKYYFRILDKIAELENEKAELESEKVQFKQTLQPKEYCHLVVSIAKIDDKIKVLRGLL